MSHSEQMLLCVLLALAAPQAPLTKELAAVESAYDDTEFEDAIARASRLLKGPARLSPLQRRRLLELSAFASFYLGRKGPAETQLRELFDLDAEADIDRKKVTPELAQFFDDVKLRWFDAKKAALNVVPVVPDTPPETRPETTPPLETPPLDPGATASAPIARPAFRAVTLIPFGIGQMAIGDYAAGVTFFVLDAALAATMVTLYWVRESEKVVVAGVKTTTYLDPQRAFAMQIAQDVAAFSLIAVGIIGFIDALAFSPMRMAEKNAQPTVAPTVSALPGGASLGVAGRF